MKEDNLQRLPYCYGMKYKEDLEEVCDQCGFKNHCEVEYFRNIYLNKKKIKYKKVRK